MEKIKKNSGWKLKVSNTKKEKQALEVVCLQKERDTERCQSGVTFWGAVRQKKEMR